MTAGVRHLALRFTIPAAGLTAMGVLALLYCVEPQYYYRVLGFIGIETFRYPFVDFQSILAAVECWQRGIDVYVNNSCGGFGYSPLWLYLVILPSKEWTNTLGLCLPISFFLTLALLPPPRSRGELLVRLVATVSPVTAFAVERANIDLLMFVIATAAGVLLLGPLHRRLAAYTMIVIAGLLKVYPLVLMVLTSRERPRAFFCVNAMAAAVVLATYLYFHAEVMKMMPNIPHCDTFSDCFGAHLLPDLIASKAGTTYRLAGLVKVSTFAALFVAMVGWFLYVVRWRSFCVALARLPKPEKMFLLIGAALISGCFFAGSSVGYRGIHLLFTLPGLAALARTEGDLCVRRVAGARVRACGSAHMGGLVHMAWAIPTDPGHMDRKRFRDEISALLVDPEPDRVVAGRYAFRRDLDRLFVRVCARMVLVTTPGETELVRPAPLHAENLEKPDDRSSLDE
jgi:hypothetical protein